MQTTVGYWAIGAVVLIIAIIVTGWAVRGQVLGVLVDNRGRYSLAQFQIVAWTIVILPLIAAVFVARYLALSPVTALDFTIPRTLLLVMGISLGSLVASDAIKGTKDQTRPESIAASNNNDRPRLWQLFTLEEGALADKAIDIGKFQNFWLTLILIAAYVAMTVSILNGKTPESISALPDFSDAMIALLLVSHAGYLANKLPVRDGEPGGLTVALRDAEAQAASAAAAAAAKDVLAAADDKLAAATFLEATAEAKARKELTAKRYAASEYVARNPARKKP